MKKIFGLFLFFLATNLSAQTSLPPIVVTPDKSATLLENTPAHVQIITHEDIEAQGATSIPEALHHVPGLDVVNSGSSGDDIDLRLRGADRDEVLLLLDGIPINSVREHRTLFIGNLPIENVDRIEILQGSQSVLYGSDAVGGVINIITKKGSAKIQPFIGIEGGSLGTFNERAGISGSHGKSLWHFTTSRQDQRGRFERDRYGANSITGNFSYQFLPELRMEVGAEYVHSNQEIFYEILTSFDPSTSSLIIRLDPDNNRTLGRDLLETHSTWEAKPFAWWTTTLQYGFFGDWDRGLNLATGDTAPPGYTVGSQDFHGHGFRHHLDTRNLFTWATIGPWSATTSIGFEFEQEEIGFTDPPTTYPAPGQEGDRQNYAPYFLQNFGFLDNTLIVSGGFRWDHNSTFGTEFSPRTSLLYKLKKTGTSFRAGYSEGFHGPTILDFYNQILLQATGSPSFQAARLQSELSKNYEVGIDQSLFKMAKLSTTFFYLDYDRLFDELQFIQNAYTTGLETGLVVTPWAGLKMGGNYTFMKAVNQDDGTHLANRPENRFHFFAEIIPLKKFLLRTDLNIIGDRLVPSKLSTSSGDLNYIIVDTNGNASGSTLSGYAKLDLSLSYLITDNRWGLSDWKVYGVVENLLDDEYQEKFGLPAPGMHFRLGSRCRF